MNYRNKNERMKLCNAEDLVIKYGHSVKKSPNDWGYDIDNEDNKSYDWSNGTNEEDYEYLDYPYRDVFPVIIFCY
jgi:hypothetical protein